MTEWKMEVSKRSENEKRKNETKEWKKEKGSK